MKQTAYINACRWRDTRKVFLTTITQTREGAEALMMKDERFDQVVLKVDIEIPEDAFDLPIIQANAKAVSNAG